MAKAERTRLIKLEEANELKEKRLQEKKAYDVYIDKREISETKMKEKKLIEERNLEGKGRIDEQKKKRINGEVKWFSEAKGYGFIKRENEEKDIFVHFSAVRNAGLKYLKKGEQLTFEVENTDKGPSAINLQKTVNEVSRSHLRVVK